MGKRGVSELIIIFLLVILAILAYHLYLMILDYTAESIPLIQNKTDEKESFSSSPQFYPNMRFIKKSLIYNTDESCPENKIKKMQQAFVRIEGETELKFYQNIIPENADILVTCREEVEEAEQILGEYFLAGEGGPTSIINTSLFYIIEKGKILLYSESTCDNYDIELHELLHVLGFKHSNNKESIMYNITYCNQILTSDIINELNRVYSIQVLPDLHFSDIKTKKHGSYLDFDAEITNQGLAHSEKIKLEVYSDKKLDDFDLGNIKYGEGKIIEAKNVKVGRDTKKIKFIIIAGEELDKENNIIELFLP